MELSQAYAAKNGLELVDDGQLEDIGVSAFKGANIKDGALGGFLEAINAKKIQPGSYLLVESLDRISRQEVRKSLSIFLQIIDGGINLVTLADNRIYTPEKTEEIDLITSLVIMSRAHEESVTKSRRVAAAWANKRTNAEAQPLTAMCPAWLKLSADKSRYEVIPERAELVRTMFKDSAAGIGNYALTRRLNQKKVAPFGRSKSWCTSYVSKIVASRAALGEYQPHRMVAKKRVPVGDPIKNYFPAVVDKQLFYQATAARRQRSAGGGGRKGTHISNLFSRFAVCVYCALPMRFVDKGSGPKGGAYLVCDSARRGTGCSPIGWRYDHFETAFLSYVTELELDQILVGQRGLTKQRELEKIISALIGEREHVASEQARAYELYNDLNAGRDFVAKRLDKLGLRLIELDAAIKEGEAHHLAFVAEARSATESKDEIKALIQQLRETTGDELYKLRSKIAAKLRSLIDQVDVAPNGINAQKRERSADVWADRRYFTVIFKDHTLREVYPKDDDPTQVWDNYTETLRSHPSNTVVASSELSVGGG